MAFAKKLSAGVLALVASSMLCALAALSLPSPALAQSVTAEAFVQKLGNDAIAQLTDKSVSDSDRVKRMRTMLQSSFDVPAVSKFVLGTAWARTSDAQRSEFQKLYVTIVAHNYAGLFKRYSGETFQVLGDVVLDAQTTVVKAQINQTDGAPPVPVELQVDRVDSDWKAIDIKIDGISMPQTHRKEYASVINRSRNGVEGLLDAMRAKAKELEADEPSE